MDGTRTAPRLLDTLAEIDGDWLESVLHAAGHSARVREFAIQPIGAGNVSDTARIVLTTDGDAPASIVAKFRPSTASSHAHGVGSGAYSIEAGAYRLFAAATDGCRIPRILWLAGTDDNINLVMEDLSRVTRAGDQVAGCGVEDARRVITQFARLHRTFWPLASKDAPPWAIRMPSAGDYWVPVLESAVSQVAQRFADLLPDRHIALVAEAATVSRAWHDLRHPAMTITHGDPRVDNVLFDDDAGEAILIDWQVAGVRNPMHDVGYFLSGSVSIEDRRTSERELLDLYADEFGATRGYVMNRIVDDYRIQLISGLMTTAAAVALLPDAPPVNRLLLALLERNCAAVEDWGSIAAIRRRM
ncbi:phosphotransferase [Sphingomonas sp. SUN019]|uniref:phosphotransferase n=1 Tax=Sphingomonas sp. SUN019 TaxID=2937788 RepID=UPI0021648DEA|nr:phosphotransferase [Sphingomonas sp. SUN019]UVO51042.1 phosphotransferase [Sphingomonas sp. SUN019]